MAFIEELLNHLGQGEWTINLVYPKGLAVCGYKKILELTNEQIELSLPQKKKLVICGGNLSILSLAESELYIGGIISKVEVL